MTGSFPPDVCGVGDYSDALIRSLRAEGVGVDIFYEKKWSLRALFSYASRLRKHRSRVLNVQYPTQGYGWSIVPPLLCLLVKPRRSVVTLHEFSRRSFKAKCVSWSFFLVADWVIFTTDNERESGCKTAPWIRPISSVIPLASSIPMMSSDFRDIDIAYFGHLRPDKGLEDFVAIIASLRKLGKFRVAMIGQLVEGFEEYGGNAICQLKSLEVDIILNRSAEEVSEFLSRVKIALLPFPDGVTLRRTTALASMGNGALLVTRASPDMDPVFEGICVAVAAGSDISGVVIRVLRQYDEYESTRFAGQEFARSFSWSSIAASYIEVLTKVAD